MDHEWTRSAADLAWRRTKLGLRLSPAELGALDEYVGQRQRGHAAAVLADGAARLA